MRIEEIIKKLEAYFNEEAVGALDTYLSDNFDEYEEIDTDLIDAWEVINYNEFIYFEDAEKYLKNRLDGFFSQSIIELCNQFFEEYGTQCDSICELASYELYNEINECISFLN